MIKRVALIAILTGIGQLVSIFSIKFTYQRISTEHSTSFAQIDSLLFLLLNLVGLGLQSAAMRNIAVLKDWKSEYEQTQSARLLFSFILLLAGISAIFKEEYILFMVAPLLALSGDYALYAVGKPVVGAVISCLRSVVPYSILMAAAYLRPELATAGFVAAWILVYILTDKLIANILDVKLFPHLRWKDLKRYVESLHLGVISLAYYFLGIGILLIVPYFYPPATGALAFIGLKFYVLYKGVLRIIHQAFIKEMIQDEWCLRVDRLSMLVSLAFLASVLFFPHAFISLFFGIQYQAERPFFLTIAAGAVIYSLCLSTGTKSMLEKKDLPYTIVASSAAFLAILCSSVLCFFNSTAISIGISICAGELVMFLGFVFISSDKNLLLPRLAFLIANALLLIIPVLFRYFLEDNLQWYVLSMIILSFALFLMNYKRLGLFTKV
jgi:hypothetical protein